MTLPVAETMNHFMVYSFYGILNQYTLTTRKEQLHFMEKHIQYQEETFAHRLESTGVLEKAIHRA